MFTTEKIDKNPLLFTRILLWHSSSTNVQTLSPALGFDLYISQLGSRFAKTLRAENKVNNDIDYPVHSKLNKKLNEIKLIYSDQCTKVFDFTASFESHWMQSFQVLLAINTKLTNLQKAIKITF